MFSTYRTVKREEDSPSNSYLRLGLGDHGLHCKLEGVRFVRHHEKCEAGGEISGTFGGGGGSPPQLRAAMLTATETPDAAQFYIDTTGSTIAYPATGTVTISLVVSFTDTVQAAKLFAWTRSGNIIRLTDPDAVNAWAAANGGKADKMTYKMTMFQSNYGIGDQQMKVTSVYEGTATASCHD